MTVAVILAAGVGSRLRPLTLDRPKCLVPLDGETILGRMVRLLTAAGVRELVVSTGYAAPMVAAALQGAAMRVTLVHNPDYEVTQNAVSLRRALDVAPPGPVIKFDGDLVFSAALLARGLDGDGSVVLVDDRAPPRDEAMKVACEAERALRFGKGLDPAMCRGESIGVERFSAEDRETITAVLREAHDAGETNCYYEDLYDRAIARGVSLRVVSVADLPWTEVDDHDDLARARSLVRAGL
jgi:choline kinase